MAQQIKISLFFARNIIIDLKIISNEHLIYLALETYGEGFFFFEGTLLFAVQYHKTGVRA